VNPVITVVAESEDDDDSDDDVAHVMCWGDF
jgi:hypothetical protein